MKRKFVYYTVSLLIVTILALSSGNATVKSESYPSFGRVGFTPGNDRTPPISPGPDSPGVTVPPLWPEGVTPPPGTSGPLSIDYVSSLDFGINNISTQDRTYYAKSQKYKGLSLETPHYIQVTDNRGTLAGWSLKVVAVSQFYQEEKNAKHPILEGAMLSLKNPETLSNNKDVSPKAQEVFHLVPKKETVVATAEKGAGAGTWIIRWGDKLAEQSTLDKNGKTVKEKFNKDVQLFVPGRTIKDAASYTTQLKWILSELPQNR